MKSKLKLAWTLFAIMTVAVIVLSSILIFNSVKWKSGDELLGFDIDDVQSAYLYKYLSGKLPIERVEYNLSEEEKEYIFTEFRRSKFERTNGLGESGKSGVVFTLKDGSQREFYTIGGKFYIDGKRYECHSYLGRYISHYGFDK